MRGPSTSPCECCHTVAVAPRCMEMHRKQKCSKMSSPEGASHLEELVRPAQLAVFTIYPYARKLSNIPVASKDRDICRTFSASSLSSGDASFLGVRGLSMAFEGLALRECWEQQKATLRAPCKSFASSALRRTFESGCIILHHIASFCIGTVPHHRS